MHQGHDGIALCTTNDVFHVVQTSMNQQPAFPCSCNSRMCLRCTSWGSGIFQHCSTLSTCFIMFHCSNCSYIRLVCDCKGLGNLGKSCESSNTLPCWHPVQRRPVTCFATLWAKRTLLSCREQRQKPMSSKAKAKSQITRIAKGETAANVRNRIHTAAA